MNQENHAQEEAKPLNVTQDDKTYAIIGYISVLCLVPLFLKKDSAFACYHAKQGLIITGLWVLLSIGNVVPLLGQIAFLVGSVVLLYLSIKGIIAAAQGRYWEAPVIGAYAKQVKF